MKVVLCEKPSVAKDIADVLGASTKKDGYYEGNNYQITYAFGHLFGLENPEAYDEKFKDWSNFPIIPSVFKIKINEDAGAKKQFKIISNLLKDASLVINAGDAGREGELIQRYIIQMANYKGTVKRLWISSLTHEAIKTGFNNLIDASEKDSLFLAGKARAEADWLIGINATRCLTSLSKSTNVLSLGRVQTPVLSLIAERFLSHTNFKPKTYFVPKIKILASSPFYASLIHDKKIESLNDANLYFNPSNDAMCVLAEFKDKIENQPLLYDLTTLQSDCNKLFNFSAQQTLDIMQCLYETHKILSYPRTDSKYISEDIFNTIPKLISNVLSFLDFNKFQSYIQNPLPKNCVNNAKVSDHHAIIPTGKNPIDLKLTKNEQAVFELVCKKFLSAFSFPCIKATTKYVFEYNTHKYSATGSVIKNKGWRSILDDVTDKEDEKELIQALPELKPNCLYKIGDKLASKETTKKPSLFTEASLLDAMKTCGRSLDDPELKKNMSTGIGTPATRAAIIETLIDRKYIIRNKNKLEPTSIGLLLYENLKNLDIASPILTGKWENALALIESHKLNVNIFNDEIRKYTLKLIADIGAVAPNISFQIAPLCPLCLKNQIRETKISFSCSDYQNCNFSIYKEFKGTKYAKDKVFNLVSENPAKALELSQLMKGSSSNMDSVLKPLKNLNDFKFFSQNNDYYLCYHDFKFKVNFYVVKFDSFDKFFENFTEDLGKQMIDSYKKFLKSKG